MDDSQYRTIRVACTDLNGQFRGKRVPEDYVQKVQAGAVRLPLSVLNVDIFGADIEDSPLVFETGDSDGVLIPTARGAVPMPWLETPSTLIPTTLQTEAGDPFDGDPRHALSRVLGRFKARGWSVIAATELEFFLTQDTAPLAPAKNPMTGNPLAQSEILSLQELDAFDAFFTDLYAACDAMGIPAHTTTAESGAAQFEVTLNHGPAMKAADDTVLFKHMVKGLARKHGMAATFAAKPFGAEAGNGMHLHFSVFDADGANVFDNGAADGSDQLRHAVAGCLSAMAASTLIFAPHANSYSRLVPDAHAPTHVAWGYDNRTVAVRIPGGPTAARRIEHRVAGGDVNPYLMFAAVFGATMNGIQDAKAPTAAITGNAYAQDLEQLAPDWDSAINAFASSPDIARIFPTQLIKNLVMTKRQEVLKCADLSDAELLRLTSELV